MRDLLAYDLVGVQTHRDLGGMVNCFQDGLGLSPDAGGGIATSIAGAERRTQLSAHAIGIDTRGFAATADERLLGKDILPPLPECNPHAQKQHVANHGARGFQQYTRTRRAGQEAEEPEASEYVVGHLARA